MAILAVAILIVLCVWWWRWRTEQPVVPTPPPTQAEIVVDAPVAGATIISPLIVQGEAKGPWYFEASFPVRVEDAAGTMLGQAPATAQGEWMQVGPVPFVGSIPFVTSTSRAGFVVFAKDNPSGLPEHAAEFRVPIIFAEVAPIKTTAIKVFFQNQARLGAGQDICTTTLSVTRQVTSTPAIGRAALEALVAGPTSAETAAGFTSSLPVGVKVQRLVIENGVARADFSTELDRNVGGACRVTAIRRQITDTLTQFPTVKSVVISINGETETILQP